jgi:hypothetical protein
LFVTVVSQQCDQEDITGFELEMIGRVGRLVAVLFAEMKRRLKDRIWN